MATLYEYCTSAENNESVVFSNYWEAQSFIVGATGHRITSIKLKLSRYGSYPDVFTVSIRNADGSGRPTGSDLTSGSINGNSLPEYPTFAWTEIAVTSLTVSASTAYTIVFRAPYGDASNCVYYRISTSNPDGSITASQSSDSGSSWSVATGWDAMFEVWGGPLPYQVTISESVGFSDSMSRSASFKQALAEKLGFVDSISRRADFKQAIADSIGLVDSTLEEFTYKVHKIFKAICSKIKGYNGF
jgi:hypothetical protein